MRLHCKQVRLVIKANMKLSETTGNQRKAHLGYVDTAEWLCNSQAQLADGRSPGIADGAMSSFIADGAGSGLNIARVIITKKL